MSLSHARQPVRQHDASPGLLIWAKRHQAQHKSKGHILMLTHRRPLYAVLSVVALAMAVIAILAPPGTIQAGFGISQELCDAMLVMAAFVFMSVSLGALFNFIFGDEFEL